MKRTHCVDGIATWQRARLFVQEWKKNKVYPDFIFVHERQGKTDRILAREMKGPHLEGNLETKYKKFLATFSRISRRKLE